MKNDFLKNWDTQLKKGLLPLFVLQVIQTKDRYGYELIEELKATAGFDVTESTIYPLLVRLMNEGLLTAKWVEQVSGIPRKYYALTKEGAKKFKEMKQSMKQIITKLPA